MNDDSNNRTKDDDSPAAPKPSSVLSRRIIRDGQYAPGVPDALEKMGVDTSVVSNLMLKWAHTVPNFTSQWATGQLQLPVHLVNEICWRGGKSASLAKGLPMAQPLAVSNSGSRAGVSDELCRARLSFDGYRIDRSCS